MTIAPTDMGRLNPTPAGRKFKDAFLMFEDKTLICKDCGQEFVFSANEQEFYAENDSLMNLVVAHPVVQPESDKLVVMVADTVASNEKCSQQFALNVEKRPWFLFNHPVTNQSIAVTVSNHSDARIGKSFRKTSQALLPPHDNSLTFT